jgi:hypothetical protein
MPIQSANPPELFTLEQWLGVNQQALRGGIEEQELWWNENLFTIGPSNLRSLWGLGPAIYTAPAGTTILRMFFGFIGYPTPQFAAPGPPYGGRMGWMFLSNGNVDQVDLDLGTVTQLGSIWTPISPQYWASAVVWRPRFFGAVAGQNGGVLFGSPKGLFAWDGQTLYSPGQNAPGWLTDQGTGSTAPPTVMPSGLPGIYCMEVYHERLFVAGKDVISFSAPSNGADFSAVNGGGSVGYFGDNLIYSYMDLAASAGYLFCFGDSSTDLISNIQLSGSGTTTDPFVTNFNYANIDPQVGHRFPRPVGRIGRYMTMFNGAGIFLMVGGSADEIGSKITNIYNTLDTSQYLPTMAAATIYGSRVMLCNGRFTDPWGVTRNLILMWHPSLQRPFWSVASQGLELTHIGYYEQDSIITPYGTDGTSLYQLFARPDATLRKRLSTKALRGQQMAQLVIKNWKRVYLEVHDNSGGGVMFTGTLSAGDGGVPGGVQDIGFELQGGATQIVDAQATACAGIWGAVDLDSYSPDFTIERLHIASEGRTLFGA